MDVGGLGLCYSISNNIAMSARVYLLWSCSLGLVIANVVFFLLNFPPLCAHAGSRGVAARVAVSAKGG